MIRTTMNRLKRKSCSECYRCAWVLDELDSYVRNGEFPPVDDAVENAVYECVPVKPVFYQDGEIDYYELEFKRVGENDE